MNVKQHIMMTASEIAMGRYMRAPDHSAADEFAQAFDSLSKEDDKGAAAPVAGEGGADAGGGAAAGAANADAGGAEGGAAAGAGGAAGEGAAAAPGAGDGAAEPGADGAAPAADAGAAGEGAGGAAAGEAGADAGAAPAADAPKPGPDADDVDAILKRMAEVAKEAQPAAAAAASAAEDAPPLYTADEEAVLAKFDSEWSEVSEAFNLRNRAFGRAVVSYVFDQFRKEFEPVRELTEFLAARAHVGDLKTAVGEYTDQEREQIIEWTKTQPPYLQKAYGDVIESGTAEEVADLVQRYRGATGAQPAGGPAAAEAPKGDTELSGAAKQAAAALAPVGSKRSVVQSPEDASNFDGAWEKWKAELEV